MSSKKVKYTPYEKEGTGKMIEEIKKCPFCDGNAVVQGITVVWVKCLECGAETTGFRDEEEAIEAWNRRAGEEE